MKLEEGLENQHREFIKLQELYTELFESYKQKEIEISERKQLTIQLNSNLESQRGIESPIAITIMINSNLETAMRRKKRRERGIVC